MAMPNNETKSTTPNTSRMPNMFEQATETFKTTMDAGLKFQQDAVKSMMGCFSGMDRFDDVRQRIEAVTNDSITMIRKNAERTQKLFDDQCRSGMDLINKSFETAKSGKIQNGNVVEQCRSAWKNGFDAMCTGIDAMAKANVQAVENWASFFDKTLTACEMPATAK